MDQIVEAVPNFSTSDKNVISEITTAIKSVKGVTLLDVDNDRDYNRVVVTFVGSPENIVDGAFAAISKATELIDMTKHTGEHPRLGATDVCPFVPVKNVSFETCNNLAKDLASRVANELNLPVFLYGKAASTDERVKLSNIRKGEYEGLKEKILLDEWKPDYGPATYVEKTGALVTGVRDFLIAYNINLDTQDVKLANEVAGIVRESGRWVEVNGERVREKGIFKGVQAMGVTLERPNRSLTQVSMNLLSYKDMTNLHEIYEGVQSVASERGVKVTGSEIVGLVPLEAILMAGRYFAPGNENQAEIVQAAIDKLGLSDLETFTPNQKIIELMLNGDLLVDLTVSAFITQLVSDSPAPGGGSVSALGGALASSLASMVANLTVGKEKFADVNDVMQVVLQESQKTKDKMLHLIDEDTKAFNAVMDAFKMPKEDPEPRKQAIQEAMKNAALVPLHVAEKSLEVFDFLTTVAEKGNKNAITDAGTGAYFAEAAIKGALLNVNINLLSIKDESLVTEIKQRVERITSEVASKRNKVIEYVNRELQ